MPEERRVVTVLFADVANSTALGEANDPEDVRALLGRYYDIAKRVIEEYGGTLEKFIGDAVMAVFGLPQAHGDDAVRALAAALALREGMAADPETRSLTLRFGVNTGEVVGSRGTRDGDFLVTGDAVNVAARLQQHADAGTILVGERTQAAADASFRFGPDRVIEVKGKSTGIRAATLEERILSHAGIRRAPTPFVGRDADLAQLELVARRAFTERRPQLVTIIAPAGTGKSRLVEEFLLRLPGLGEKGAVAIAQCLPYGSAVTYLPLRGLVSGIFGGRDDESLLRRIESTLLEAGHETADATRIASLVGATLGRSDEVEERERDEFFGAWRVLIEAMATTRQLVLVFEDLHWASGSLLDLVDHVTLPRTRAPLLMIALGRPELLDRRPTWGAARRNFTALGLEPLTESETGSLVGLLVPDAPEGVRERIVERSGGNAFFANELVRAYRHARAAGASEQDIVLPDTVQATVLARMDALPERARTVLQQGAVAGRTVWPEAIRALLPELGLEEVRDILDDLSERQLLAPQGPRAYTFSHIVIREVAYSTLPRAERIRAHLRLARSLEESSARDGEAQAELVAYHYRQAIALSPAKLPEGLDAGRAIAAFERAGTHARMVGARQEAVGHLREAIRLAPEEEHMRLHELLGDASAWGDEALGGYRAAYERWRALDPSRRDEVQGARLLRKRLVVEVRWTGSISSPAGGGELDRLFAEAEALLARTPDTEERARLDILMPFRARFSGPKDEARDEARLAAAMRARDHFDARGDANAVSEALDGIASFLRQSGQFERAIERARERIDHSDRLTLLERTDAWNVLVWDLTYLGRYAETLRTADAARRSYRPGEPEEGSTHAFAWAALAGRLSGDWDDVLQRVDQLRIWWENAGRPTSGRFALRGWYAGLHVARARLDETRVAAYRSAATVILNEQNVSAWLSSPHTHAALVSADVERGLAALRDRLTPPEYRGEVLAKLVLEDGAVLADELLDTVERDTRPTVGLLTERVALARALHSGDEALAAAVQRLDAAGLHPDAARAAAVLAQRRGDAAALATARARLEALGDRLYLVRLSEGSEGRE